MKPTRLLLITLPVAVLVIGWSLWGGRERVDFGTQVKPILNKNCLACHGGVKRAGGFSLLFREEALAPTESGKPAIIPGDADNSEFIKRLTHPDPDERMPLKAEPLKPDEIDLLTRWVNEGAEWSDHWAYVPPKAPDVPGRSLLAAAWTLGERWERNEIDYFVSDRLKTEGLSPSPEADRATLLRRVSLDLTGLPPTPPDYARFLADESPDAYEKAVDRLLASPRFGERWASMWLDLARYADSRGYQKDNGRQIWAYRDWVIRAFNADMPFDQFTVEQLAGDLLPQPTDEQLIATGFHRNTMNNDETGTVDEEFRVAALLDRVNTTWDVWHGTTFSCVQCHSHPYDPFRHEEYYKFMAFLNNTRDEDTQDEAPTLRRFADADARKLDSLTTWIRRNVSAEQAADITRFLRTREPRFHAHYADQYVNGALVGDRAIGGRNGGSCRLPNLVLTDKTHMLLNYSSELPGGLVTFHLDRPDGPVLAQFRVDTARSRTVSVPINPPIGGPVAGRHHVYLTFRNATTLPTQDFIKISWFALWNDLPGPGKPDYVRQQQRFWELLDAKAEQTPILLESHPDYRRKTHVFVRGNWLVHGPEVAPDVPKSMHPFPATLPRNRLGLARWLVSQENPLTARTVVNRYWEQLFGTGLVETLEDFGTQGAKPSHPELLDFLAVRFLNEFGWRPKPLLRYIVLSATYRQRSDLTPALRERDPANRLLARGPRVRLTAEQVRDQMLAVSGLLSAKMYGKPVMPYQPEGVWQAVNSSLRWEQSTGEDQYRRAIYTFARRTSPYPSMATFDASSREVCLARRIRTNTPLQALTLLNDPVFVEAARHLARRGDVRRGDARRGDARRVAPAEQIRSAYRLMLGRPLPDRQLHAYLNLYHVALTRYRRQPDQLRELLPDVAQPRPELGALTLVTHAMLNTDEFVTKN